MSQVDGGNLPVGVLEKRDFTLSLTDDETLRTPRLPFWHVDYFTQPQLDDPGYFVAPDWPLPLDDVGPPVDVLGPPTQSVESAAALVRPERLCPSPPLPTADADEIDEASAAPVDPSLPPDHPGDHSSASGAGTSDGRQPSSQSLQLQQSHDDDDDSVAEAEGKLAPGASSSSAAMAQSPTG